MEVRSHLKDVDLLFASVKSATVKARQAIFAKDCILAFAHFYKMESWLNALFITRRSFDI